MSPTKQSSELRSLTLGSLSPGEQGTRDFGKVVSFHLEVDRTILFKLSPAEDFDDFLVTAKFYISNTTSLIATLHVSEDHQESPMFRGAVVRLNAGDYDVQLSVRYEAEETITSHKSGEVMISVYG